MSALSPTLFEVFVTPKCPDVGSLWQAVRILCCSSLGHHLHLESRDDKIYIYIYIPFALSSSRRPLLCLPPDSLLASSPLSWVAPVSNVVDGVIQDGIFLVYIHHSNLTANLTLFTLIHSRATCYSWAVQILHPLPEIFGPPGTNFTGVQI